MISPSTAQSGLFASAAIFLLAIGGMIDAPLLRAALFSVAAVIGLTAIGIGSFTFRRRQRDKTLSELLETIAGASPVPQFVTGPHGEIGYQNAAARSQFGVLDGQGVIRVLQPFVAVPEINLARLFAQAAKFGRAREHMRNGSVEVDLCILALDGARFLWSFEMNDRLAQDRSPLPRALVGPGERIDGMNAAMRSLLGRTARTLDDLQIAETTVDLPVRNLRNCGGVDLIEAGLPGGLRELIAVPATGRQQKGEDAFDALPVPILQMVEGGQVCQANRLARQLLEIDEGTPHDFADLVEGLGRPVSEWLGDAFAGRGLHRPEVVRASLAPSELFLQITLGRIDAEDGKRLVAVLHDATELKTLEAQFVQSQKMQAIGQLAGGVAHDFNNLLTAISGHCDLLLLRHDESDPEFADLEQINQNANRAASLVGQLLAFSRKQNLRPEPLDLRDTLSDLTHLLNRLVGERVNLAFDHDPELKMVRADKRQLEQVIMNLVVNARDAMPSGGDIKISTQCQLLIRPLQRDRVTVPAGEYVIVRVRDEGTGITPDKLPKVFEPFFTTKRTGEGTGLGLSTAYGIVKQTGGYIFADSTPGEGTEFKLYFPAHSRSGASPQPRAPATRPPRPPAVRKEGVVLLVEDEAPVRAFASRALRMRGYTVIEAEDGEAALGVLEDRSIEVDLFVTDVIMPGLDGPSWVREALKTRPGIGVVFVSGYAEESFSAHQAEIPNSVFLPKPFSLTALTQTVNDQLA
ncbi:hybrid sensor histidine kinase/response regulator [Profundibacterium mesophilum]|uniref:hybrid sensor histidine kinase/response regulator n=1 Tax=Profundibacterium mesophilum TaxID=1258573 RepID=UPI001F226F9F|nr:ATP-binding protein [Profundibacterium mesophilum]